MDKIAQAYLSIVALAQIDEALTYSQEFKADKMKGSGHDFYRDRFLEQHPLAKQAFDAGKKTEGKHYRARFPVSITETKGSPDVDVKNHLHDLGYSTDNELYRKGLATKATTVGNPEAGIPYSVKHVEHKIGGLLEKHGAPDEIKKKFTNDKFRSGATTTDYDMILTGHHHDVFGGSTGRGWKSCASMEPTDKFPRPGTGPAAKVMDHEIQNHTHHIYLVPRGGNVDTQAIARTSLKLHEDPLSGHTTLFPEGTVYGDAPSHFITHAKALADRLFEKKPSAVYMKNTDVYHDGGSRIITNGQASAESLDAAWKKTKPSNTIVRAAIMSKVSTDHKYATKGLRDTAKALGKLKDGVDSGDFVKATDGLWHAHLNIDEKAQHHMWGHPVVNDAQDKIPDMFNMHADGHIKALAHLPNSNLGNFKLRVAQNLPRAKTLNDYTKLLDLHDRGIRPSTDVLAPKIADDHSLGKDPMKAIVDHHVANGTLNHETFAKAYYSTVGMKKAKSRGNLYDQAVHFEGGGVPGMSDVVNHHAEKMVKGSGWVTPRESDVAVSFAAMKPDTRQRIADAAGVDHKELMKKHKNVIKEHKDRFNAIRAKVETQ